MADQMATAMTTLDASFESQDTLNQTILESYRTVAAGTQLTEEAMTSLAARVSALEDGYRLVLP